jgi:DNA-binding response OmpR family regulator
MKKKILIIDDDPAIREIFRIIFERSAYTIEIKADGQDILSSNYNIPDIFLIDKRLSDMDGLDLCRHLKAQDSSKKIPVIIISAFPDIGPLAKEAGADNYLEKPFGMDQLLKLIGLYTDIMIPS